MSCFPSNSVNSGSYIVPRNGIYIVSITAKVTSPLTVANSSLRFGIAHNKAGTVTNRDFCDQMASNSYATPFVTVSFLYTFTKSDIVTPFVKPLNENITIGAGSKFYMYYLGDNPKA